MKVTFDPKKDATARLSQDVLQGLRATGPGWQSRADEALRNWINSANDAEASRA